MRLFAHNGGVTGRNGVSGMRPEMERIRAADRLLAGSGRGHGTARRFTGIQNDTANFFFVPNHLIQFLNKINSIYYFFEIQIFSELIT